MNPYQKTTHLPGPLERIGPNSRVIRVGDPVLLRNKYLDESYVQGQDDWILNVGLVVDVMEDQDGFLMYEVLFENQVGWWDDIELKLVEENDVRDAS